MKTILVSSAGRRVGLINCWRRAAAEAGIDLTVIAGDVEPEMSAACQLADRSYAVPRCTKPEFIDAMIDICRENAVDLIVPTIDTELEILSGNISRFEAIGTRVHVSDPGTIAIVRDKQKTMEVLHAAGVPVPLTADPAQVAAAPDNWSWPLFLKPRGGSASQGLQVVSSVEEIRDKYDQPVILQELIDGPEYTVNVFVDSTGTMRCAVPHERLRIRAGEVEKGITRRRADLERLASAIVEAMPGLRGVFCFQALIDPQHGPRIIEINARFGGGYPLADRAGAKFCRWLLEEISDQPSTAANDWSPGIIMIRYDEAVFVETE